MSKIYKYDASFEKDFGDFTSIMQRVGYYITEDHALHTTLDKEHEVDRIINEFKFEVVDTTKEPSHSMLELDPSKLVNNLRDRYRNLYYNKLTE